MGDRVKPYDYYDTVISICPTCYRKVDGKILFLDGNVIMRKRCPEHGRFDVLIADDIDYYRSARETFVKRSDLPQHYNTSIEHGCPYDCGLCPDHEQHTCICVVEICDDCNLECPICYAGSGPHRGSMRTLEEVERMLDAVVRNEERPDIVQISGGEPTIHPQFFEILDMAKARPIRHLMVNTNGVRIARDAEFANRLAEYRKHFEVYLQFDSLRGEVIKELRGVDLRDVHQRAIARLNELDIATSLVITVKKGKNDSELGALIEYAASQPCIRGVTLQPVQDAGRTEGFDPARDRITLSEVRRAVLDQTDLFAPEDLIPVPCHPDCLAMAYALKIDGKLAPLTGLVPHEIWMQGARNTVLFEQDAAVTGHVFELFSAAHGPESQALKLSELLCCLPTIAAPADLGYQNVFRVLIVEFLDAHSMDMRSVKRSCVHMATPDGRLIPFDTFNLFYRGELEQTRLARIRNGQRGLTVLA